MVLSLSWAAPAPTPVTDPAELLPATTLAYAEVRQPGQLVKEFASLFEGSVLADVPDSLTKLLPPGEKPPRRGWGPLGGFGLLFAPEVVKEAKRLQGAAIALTGFKEGQPEWLAVVLPGESNAPAFLMRAVLATAPVTPAGEVEGVRLYRVIIGGGTMVKPRGGPPQRTPGLRPAQEKRDPLAPPQVREVVVFGPTVAMTPNALFVGSDDAVKDAIHRAKGNGKGASLAGNKNFRETRKEIGNHPGLFAYAEPAQVMAVIEKALSERARAADKRGGPRIAREEITALTALRDFVNFKAFRSVAYGLTLDKGTLRLGKLVLLNPEEKSPLLELLPSQPVKTALFQFTPSKPVLAAALSNDHGQERWAKIVKFLDAVAKLGGNKGKMPSEGIAEVEKALGIDFGKDFFGKITAASFALGNPLDLVGRRVEKQGPGGRVVVERKEIPAVFAFQTASAEDAKGLIELAPKVFALATRKQVEPVVKEIEGQKVSILGDEGGLCYGRAGSTIVFGPYSKSVAQALANGAKEKGWLSDAKLAARLEKAEAPIMLAVARPFTLLMGLTVVGHSTNRTFKQAVPPDRKPAIPPPGVRKPPALPQARALAPQDDRTRARQKGLEEDRMKKELAKLLEKEGLLIIRVTRKRDRIRSEAILTDLKPMVGRLVDYALQYFLSESPKAVPQPVPSEAAPKDAPIPPPK
jgi:hypothetical protein